MQAIPDVFTEDWCAVFGVEGGVILIPLRCGDIGEAEEEVGVVVFVNSGAWSSRYLPNPSLVVIRTLRAAASRSPSPVLGFCESAGPSPPNHLTRESWSQLHFPRIMSTAASDRIVMSPPSFPDGEWLK